MKVTSPGFARLGAHKPEGLVRAATIGCR